jgi:hypothetical protein
LGIQTQCKCGAVLKASEKLAGKRVRCPVCKQPVVIPTRAQSPSQDALGPETVNKSPALGSSESLYSNSDWDEVSKTLENAEKAKVAERAAKTNRRLSRYPEKLLDNSLALDRQKASPFEGWFQFDWSYKDFNIFLVCIFAIAASPFVFVSGCAKDRQEKLFSQDTEVTQGVITNVNETKRYRRHGRRDISYDIEVSYSVAGVRYVVNKHVGRHHFDMQDKKVITKGDPLTVQFAKADPSVAIIDGGRFDSPYDSFERFVFGILLLVVGIVGMCYLFLGSE